MNRKNWGSPAPRKDDKILVRLNAMTGGRKVSELKKDRGKGRSVSRHEIGARFSRKNFERCCVRGGQEDSSS